VAKLIEKHGRKGNLMKWREQLNGDCPKRDAHSLQDRCDVVCSDLPKVLLERASNRPASGDGSAMAARSR
jgi:hypothetical protein